LLWSLLKLHHKVQFAHWHSCPEINCVNSSLKEIMIAKPLWLVSYLAPNSFWFYQAVGAYLSRALEIDIQITEGACDPLDDLLVLGDRLDLAFICGLPFIRHSHRCPRQWRAIAAPVMNAPRYQQHPVYFSDVVVSHRSAFTTLADLEGTTFCYNDPGSNSGYQLMRQALMQAEYPPHFFKQVIQSGAHQRSLRWVADGLADCAAIDSTVLEQELRDYPDLAGQLRTVASIGPCPMPPVVASDHLGMTQIAAIQSALLNPDAELRSAMNKANIQGYAAVTTEDYEAIAQGYDAAIQAGYEILSAS
jgi:phosphonate transport system substrate-binding protein